jgi:hypothetical protein
VRAPQSDGSTVIMPLSVFAEDPNGLEGTRGAVMRFDVPPSQSIKAEVMVLIKGPVDAILRAPAPGDAPRRK